MRALKATDGFRGMSTIVRHGGGAGWLLHHGSPPDGRDDPSVVGLPNEPRIDAEGPQLRVTFARSVCGGVRFPVTFASGLPWSRRRLQPHIVGTLGMGPGQNACDQRIVERCEGICRVASAKDRKAVSAVDRGGAASMSRVRERQRRSWWGSVISPEQANYKTASFVPYSKQRTRPGGFVPAQSMGTLPGAWQSLRLGRGLLGTTAIATPR
jgi:hypothetical protein